MPALSQPPRTTTHKARAFELKTGTPRACPSEFVPAKGMCLSSLGQELGSAIRTVITRLHRLAPSLEGHAVPVIESRLKEAEDEILGQLQVIDERLTQWQASD